MELELRHLRYFAVLAESLHFGVASTRLGIEQSTLSQLIKRLEENVGVKLFNRSSRHVALTLAGARFLDDARLLLDQAADAVHRARQNDMLDGGHLRIGLLVNTLFDFLPSVLKPYRRLHPDVSISIEETPIPEQIARLRENLLDVIFIRRPHIIECNDIECIDIVPLPGFVAAVPTGSPLSRFKVLSLMDLAEEQIILYPTDPSPDIVSLLHKACRRCDFTPNIIIEANTMFAILALVASGLGISIMGAPDLPQQPRGVTFVPIKDLHFSKGSMMVMGWLRGGRMTPALRSFLEIARKFVPQDADRITTSAMADL